MKKHLLYLLLIGIWRQGHAELTGQSCSDDHYVRDPDVCNIYYRCVNGQYISMPACEDFMAFSMTQLTCVIRGTIYDDCKDSAHTKAAPTVVVSVEDSENHWLGSTDTNSSGFERRFGHNIICTVDYSEAQIDVICNAGHVSIFANPVNCHKYYDCRNFIEYVHECPYPQLFSTDLYHCMDYDSVSCHNRYEPKAPCEYEANLCQAAHCPSCSDVHGSCLGLPDGKNAWDSRLWSPYYLECADDRTIENAVCTDEAHPLFSPVYNDCVDIYHIPKEHGGLMPTCASLVDGLYPDETGRCPYYFQSRLNTFEAFYMCPVGTWFDTGSKTCAHPDNACAPCGANNC